MGKDYYEIEYIVITSIRQLELLKSKKHLKNKTLYIYGREYYASRYYGSI